MSTENEKKLEEMLAAFEKNHATEGKNLRELVGNTPEIKQYMLDAIGKGNLTSINPLDAQTRADGAVGTYDPTNRSMQLPMDYLAISDKDPSAANMLRMTVGHELQHAINRDSIAASQDKLNTAIDTISQGPSPHDYTAALKAYNTDSRDREARDEMAGFNVLAAHVKRENPDATQQELYRKLYDSQPGEMASYFDTKGTAPNQTYEPKPGITLNDKFQVEATKENVEAFGKNFYDGRNYPANYMGAIIEGIADYEKKTNVGNPNPPEMRVNLGELGLTQGTSGRQNEVALPSNVVDTTSPRLAPTQPSPEPASPKTGHDGHDHATHSEGHQHGNNRYVQEILDRLNITAEDRQQFRNDGQQQFQQLESQKAQEAKPLQPTQESPVQETPARKMGAM
jgi:hypothetical protein